MDKALAVKYLKELPAPFVVAKGRGELAVKIKQLALENDITIINDEKALENLFFLEAGEYIPAEYYELMAEILTFVYSLEERK